MRFQSRPNGPYSCGRSGGQEGILTDLFVTITHKTFNDFRSSEFARVDLNSEKYCCSRVWPSLLPSTRRSPSASAPRIGRSRITACSASLAAHWRTIWSHARTCPAGQNIPASRCGASQINRWCTKKRRGPILARRSGHPKARSHTLRHAGHLRHGARRSTVTRSITSMSCASVATIPKVLWCSRDRMPGWSFESGGLRVEFTSPWALR